MAAAVGDSPGAHHEPSRQVGARQRGSAWARQTVPRRRFGAAGSNPPMDSQKPALNGRQLKLTGSFDGFLFPVPGDAERLGKVQGSVVQRQPMDRSPKIKRVALRTAILLEASKSILG